MTSRTRPAVTRTARPARRRASLLASWALVGVLTLTGCGATDTSGTSGTASTGTTTSISDAVDVVATTGTDDATTTAGTIADTTAAAAAFLATLTDEQRETVLLDYDDDTRTTSWSNFPVTFVQRAGLNLADLTEEQQTAALDVLEALLSDEA